MAVRPALAVRRVVIDRDGESCVRCWRRGEQIHHRHAAQMGGSSEPWVHSPANLVLLCAGCHLWVESQRTEATELGYLVPMGVDPATVPIQFMWVKVLLDNDGGRVNIDEPGTDTPW